MKEDVSSYWITLRNERMQYIDRGSIRPHSAENSPWRGYGPVI